MNLFHDRREAGRRLAEMLADYAGRDDVLVVALPRGGVPVAFEIAKTLAAPLDVFVVRKLGVPGNEEFAFGALASGGIRIIDGGWCAVSAYLSRRSSRSAPVPPSR
jgi:predicted phosphoribosyltransferase